MRFTIKDVMKSKVAGLNQHLNKPFKKAITEIGGRKVSQHFKKKSAALDWLGWNLLYWCNEHIVILEEEYLFHLERKWRADWAIPSLKILIEFEGGIFLENSGHNTAKHYTKDTDKYRGAAKLGYIVLRYTALNYKTVLNDLNDILKSK